uniref:F-box domain-containing protein n=1 Tax=Meloidogyne hapla TaxID=6305 RepID=A0A1I8B166_MELHA
MESLPVELKLKILKYLDYESLFSVKRTNNHFNEIIDKYQKELPKKEFYSMELKHLNWNQVCYEGTYQLEKYVDKIPMKSENEKKWIDLLKNKNFDQCIYISSDDFINHEMNLGIIRPFREECSVILTKRFANHDPRYYYIDLPVHLSQIGDVRK